MVQSKPNVLRVALLRLSIFLTFGLFLVLLTEWATDWMGLNSHAIFFFVLVIFTGLFGSLVELPNAKALTIIDDKITVKNLITGKSKDILFETTDRFKISMHMQRYRGLKLNLILLKEGNQHEPISLSYVDNLAEIVNEFEKRLPNLTEDEYGLLEMVKKQQIK